MKLYVASKISHVVSWRNLKKQYPDIEWTSSWFDLFQTGSIEEEKKLSPEEIACSWAINETDILRSDILLFYHKKGETHQGALVEVGIAIAGNIPVYIKSDAFEELNTWKYHPGVSLLLLPLADLLEQWSCQ